MLKLKLGSKTKKGTKITQSTLDGIDSDMITIDFVAQSNADEILNALDKALARALDKVGLVAEGYAKRLCPVDTGRLRNSITHQLHGSKDVIIGTNVEYAPYVELGHKTKRGKTVDGVHFLKRAATEHTAQYKTIIESELEGA